MACSENPNTADVVRACNVLELVAVCVEGEMVNKRHHAHFQRKKDGLSIRQIAASLKTSTTTVQRIRKSAA